MLNINLDIQLGCDFSRRVQLIDSNTLQPRDLSEYVATFLVENVDSTTPITASVATSSDGWLTVLLPGSLFATDPALTWNQAHYNVLIEKDGQVSKEIEGFVTLLPTVRIS